MEKAHETPIEKGNREVFMRRGFNRKRRFFDGMAKDVTASRKESEEVDDDEQLSVNESGDFIGGNKPLSVSGFGEAFPISFVYRYCSRNCVSLWHLCSSVCISFLVFTHLSFADS